MNDSLSVILPARNCQEQLAAQVAHLLDVLPELTSRFEVLIVDDASTDHTEEVAHELAIEYPQVRIARHEETSGMDQAINTGVRHANGDVILVTENETQINSVELKRLWEVRNQKQRPQERLLPQKRRWWTKVPIKTCTLRLHTHSFRVLRWIDSNKHHLKK